MLQDRNKINKWATWQACRLRRWQPRLFCKVAIRGLSCPEPRRQGTSKFPTQATSFIRTPHSRRSIITTWRLSLRRNSRPSRPSHPPRTIKHMNSVFWVRSKTSEIWAELQSRGNDSLCNNVHYWQKVRIGMCFSLRKEDVRVEIHFFIAVKFFFYLLNLSLYGDVYVCYTCAWKSLRNSIKNDTLRNFIYMYRNMTWGHGE